MREEEEVWREGRECDEGGGRSVRECGERGGGSVMSEEAMIKRGKERRGEERIRGTD